MSWDEFRPVTSELDFPDGEPAAPPPTRTRRAQPRELPHSSDAEASLLACCLIDSSEAISKCREAGLSPASFFEEPHRLVFSRVLALHDLGNAVDTAVLAEDLRSLKRLDEIGGYAGLARLTNQASTTASLSFFIDKVREQALRRAIIRETTAIAEETYGLNGADPSEVRVFADGVRDRIDRVVSGHGAERYDSRLAGRLFDPAKKIEKPANIFTLAGTAISTSGNLTALVSQAKAGKTGFTGAMLASAMGNGTSGADTLGISGHNYGGLALLHFDTEQSPYDWQRMIETSVRRAKVPAPPPWLLSYTFTGLGAPDCRELVEHAMRSAFKKFGGIYAVIIDGIGDLVINPNDEEECFPLVTRLHGLAIEYRTAIINVLHLNPGSDAKSRGHLGSHLERKSESNLMMEKDASGVTRVWGVKQRGKMIPKTQARAFRWSDEAGMHVTCEASESEEARPGRKPTYSFEQFSRIWPREAAKAERRSVLWNRAKDDSKISETAFRELLKDATERGWLVRTPNSLGDVYHMSML